VFCSRTKVPPAGNENPIGTGQSAAWLTWIQTRRHNFDPKLRERSIEDRQFMKSAKTILFVVAITASRSLLAEQPSKPSSSTRDQDVLKQWVGNWEATIESTGRDGKPVKNAAKATVRLLGQRWLITDFEGTFLGAPFIGHEVLGYDPVAKKYLLNWVDSAATSFARGNGLYDSQTKTLTLTVSGRDDSTGKMTTWRQVDTWKDADHHEWSLRTISPKDGKEQIQMTIRYHRLSSALLAIPRRFDFGN
jgi:Protein of unknown function (DUF1579)